jgi:putative flavoprotein involved in K+ transport
MTEQIDTAVIGGGQAGLAISYYLTQQDREHIVLEQNHRIAESWRRRWDSFTLVTPNWMLRLPGFPYDGNEPDGFLSRDQVVAYLEQYVALFDPPLRFGTRVTSLEEKPGGPGYLVKTGNAVFEAANVVVATGAYQRPKIPPLAGHLSQEILQIHSSEYRNAQALPAGAALVVGSGQSGSQIAEELNEAGRKVYLCVGSSGRLPRRYRGKDGAWWINRLSMFNRTVDQLPSPRAKFAASAHVSGKAGGRTLNLHQFARNGVILLGHLKKAQGNRIFLAPDLKESLAKADKVAADFKKAVDEYVKRAGLDAPEETLSPASEPRDGYEMQQIAELDLASAGIKTIIWATGYGLDFGWVRVPVFDQDGYPIQQRGITDYPGLYFLGLPWLHTLKSSLIFGVGEDAAHIAADIAAKA